MGATKIKMVKSKKFQGVYVRASAVREGDECYYINYRDRNRKVKNEKVGWKSEGYNQDKAHNIRCDRIQSIRHGVELPGKKKDIPTFDQAFNQWREHQQHRGIKNLPSLILIYNKHLKLTIGFYHLDELTPKVLTGLTGGWRGKMRDGSIVNLHYIIRGTITYCIQTEEIQFSGPNPMDKVTTPKGKESRERYFTKEEAQALLNEMKKHGMEHYLFTAVGLFTGMRYSEIMNVTGKDINYENGTIRVFGKGDKVRNCEIPKDLLGKIQQVNPGPIDKLITGTVSKYSFRRICNRMGFNKDVAPGDRIHSVSAHTLRHTYGSWLAQQGTPIMIIKELMGHNDINTTMRYAKLAPRSGREEAGKLTNGIVL